MRPLRSFRRAAYEAGRASAAESRLIGDRRPARVGGVFLVVGVADFLRAIEEPSGVGAGLGFEPGRFDEWHLTWLDRPGELLPPGRPCWTARRRITTLTEPTLLESASASKRPEPRFPEAKDNTSRR